MNYIKQLEQDKAELQAQREKTLTAINDFRVFLGSEKFIGTDAHGDNKNWIGTDDVLRQLQRIKSQLEIL